jgi:hypothetical protein
MTEGNFKGQGQWEAWQESLFREYEQIMQLFGQGTIEKEKQVDSSNLTFSSDSRVGKSP